MRPVRSFTIRGQRWKYHVTPPIKNTVYRGTATRAERTVRINGELEGEQRLDTIIHEALHAALWDLSEEAVHETAEDIARLLWRLGYRAEDDVQ